MAPRARVNLIPPEIAERRRTRQLATALGVAGVVLVALLGVVYGSQELRLRSEQRALEEQEAENQTLRTRIARLAEFQQIQRDATQRVRLLEELTKSEIRWSGVLADLSLAIPSNVWLTSFSGRIEESAEENAPVGNVQLAGTTFSHLDVAKYLSRMAAVEEFVFPYLSVSAKAALHGVDVVDFASTVQLDKDALRVNQRGAKRTP